MTHTEQVAGLKRLVIAVGVTCLIAGFILALIITQPPVWINEVCR